MADEQSERKLGEGEFLTKQINCPHCGHLLDACTDLMSNRRPEKGDASVCIYCAELCIYNDDQTLRQAEFDDCMQLQSDPKLWALINKTQETAARRLFDENKEALASWGITKP